MLSPSPTRITYLFLSISVTLLSINLQVRAFQVPSHSFRIDPFSPSIKGKVHSTRNLNTSDISRIRINLWNRGEDQVSPGLNKLKSNTALRLGKAPPIRRQWIVGSHNGRRRRTTRRVLSFISSLSLNGSRDSNNNSSSAAGTKTSISEKMVQLEAENRQLKENIQILEGENESLLLEATQAQQRIVVEQFEGEGMPAFDANGEPIEGTWWGESREETNTNDTAMIASEECDEDDDGTCPIEPGVSFADALKDRAYWLVGLLTLQSLSGFILARNEMLLQSHPVIIYFLTMLVGAGGNAGNQASVRGKYRTISMTWILISSFLIVWLQ